jgi:hypothetical protein
MNTTKTKKLKAKAIKARLSIKKLLRYRVPPPGMKGVAATEAPEG